MGRNICFRLTEEEARLASSENFTEDMLAAFSKHASTDFYKRSWDEEFILEIDMDLLEQLIETQAEFKRNLAPAAKEKYEREVAAWWRYERY